MTRIKNVLLCTVLGSGLLLGVHKMNQKFGDSDMIGPHAAETLTKSFDAAKKAGANASNAAETAAKAGDDLVQAASKPGAAALPDAAEKYEEKIDAAGKNRDQFSDALADVESHYAEADAAWTAQIQQIGSPALRTQETRRQDRRRQAFEKKMAAARAALKSLNANLDQASDLAKVATSFAIDRTLQGDSSKVVELGGAIRVASSDVRVAAHALLASLNSGGDGEDAAS
jgi:hypothetical protein